MNDDKRIILDEIIENRNVYNFDEADVPSIFLRGTVAGPKSSEGSEEPGFTIVDSLTGASARLALTDTERKDCQNASVKRSLTDPNYAGIVKTFRDFIIGKGAQIIPQDESNEVKDFVEDFKKVNRFNRRDEEIVKKMLKAGEVFVRFYFTDNGKVARIPVIRLLDYWEITNIVTDSNDKETIVNYTRPYKDADERDAVEDIPVNEIVHVKHADSNEKRGLPPFLEVIQHCQYYLDWIYNRIVFNRMKTCYYLEEIVSGSPAQVTAQAGMTPDADSYTGKGGKFQKRLPKPGSKLVHNKAVEYHWLSPDVKADDAKEDGRVIRLAICAGAGVPEFILGESSQSNYASTLVAQNPFVRRVEWFRDFFEDYFKQIFEKAIRHGVDNGFLPKRSTETVMKEKAANVGVIRRLRKFFSFKEQFDKQGNIVVVNEIETKTGVDVQWPNLIAENLLQDSQAYQIHQSMGIVSDETVTQRLGYNFEEEQRKIRHEQETSDQTSQGDEFGGEPRDEEMKKQEPPPDGD